MKMRRITYTALAMCAGLLAAAPQMMAQSQVNVWFGGGTATDSSNGQSIDPLGIGVFSPTPKMGGVFLDLGAGIMLTDHYGADFDLSWRAAQGGYAGVNYRPLFYDFNGVWQPLKSTRIVPEIDGGIGGMRLTYYVNQSACDQLVGCQSANYALESSSHFQLHLAAAVRFYVTPHIFVRPAIDAHWVNNFFQFGSDWVPEYTVSVGYSFGGNQ